MSDYALDGLKIDFLNSVMVYAGTPSTGDVADVGDAMTLVLREIAAAVEAVRPGSLIEFRQPYISPAVAPFADVIRADDCPADADQNRRSTLNLRLLAISQVVHSDPVMWDPSCPGRNRVHASCSTCSSPCRRSPCRSTCCRRRTASGPGAADRVAVAARGAARR